MTVDCDYTSLPLHSVHRERFCNYISHFYFQCFQRRLRHVTTFLTSTFSAEGNMRLLITFLTSTFSVQGRMRLVTTVSHFYFLCLGKDVSCDYISYF